MDNVCEICGIKVEENSHFYRKHKIREEEYYLKYFPRFSKLTREPIRFKNREFYMNSDFNDKNEMRTWFKLHPEEAKGYALYLLQKRKEHKNPKYVLSQVELRSLGLPTAGWYNDTFGSYNLVSMELGYKKRFNYPQKISYVTDGPMCEKIFVDTREQKPLKFKVPTEIKTLQYGDYSFEDSNVFIERKSLSDFVNTLGPHFDRFCREIDKAKKNKSYLVVLVEAPISQALNFNFLPHMKFATRTSPDYVFHNVRQILQHYKNTQFVFVEGRQAASEAVIKVYNYSTKVKNWDLQYLIDKKLF